MMMMPVQKMNRVTPASASASAVPIAESDTLPTSVTVKPTTSDDVMAMTIQQEKDGSNCWNVINLFRSFIIGLGSWVTCCYCCCGFCCSCTAHSGSVKYDTPEYKGLSDSEKHDLTIQEHIYVTIVATPVSCVTCCCGFGRCGTEGPMAVADTIVKGCTK